MKELINIIEKLKINSKTKVTPDIDWIDLGLPSGTLWAKCNYKANEETDSGKYLKYQDAIKLDLPNEKDIEELQDNCDYKYISINEIRGFKLTSKINGNYIFLPICGRIEAGKKHIIGKNMHGFYWIKGKNSTSYYAPAIRFHARCEIWIDDHIYMNHRYPIRLIKKYK